MRRVPLTLVLLGLALHFVGWLWHDLYHSHEGFDTLRTQAGFYVATAVVLAGALAGVALSREARGRLGYAIVLAGAAVETGGWVWDFAAHYAGGNSLAARTTVYLGSALAALGALATVVLVRQQRFQNGRPGRLL